MKHLFPPQTIHTEVVVPKAANKRNPVQKLLADPDLLKRGICTTMKLYKCSHKNVTNARRTAYDQLLQSEDGKKEIITLRKGKEQKRLLATLASLDERYPGIIAKSVFTDNMAEVARKYGLTRARLGQIRDSVVKCAVLLGISVNTLVYNLKERTKTE